MIENQLENSLHVLLQAALFDFEILEKTPEYTVNMGWFAQIRNGVCSFCLAGALLINRFAVRDISNTLSGLDKSIQKQLRAIDSLRNGNIRIACLYLEIDPKDSPVTFPITSYNDAPKMFKHDIQKLVVVLKEYNL